MSAPKLKKAQQAMADKMFDIYDTDHSGSLDIEEFCMLMQKYDHTIDPNAVQMTFEMATEGAPLMTRPQFYGWLMMLFGECSEQEFVSGVDELIKAKDKVLPKGVEPMRLGKDKRGAMDRKQAERAIIQEYEKAQQRKDRSVCKNCGGLAVYFCNQCGKIPYCAECSQQVHQMAMFQDHRPASLAELEGDIPPAPQPVVVQPGQNPWAFQDPEKKEYVLEPSRHNVANALFTAYDADGSGYIDLKEFTTLCKSYDPRIEPGEISQGFKAVGVLNGKMDPPHFYKWLAMTFEGADDAEFNEGIQDLISCTSPAAQAGQSLNPRMQDLSKRLFSAYDKDSSGFLDFNEFYFMLKKYDPNCPLDGVRTSFKNAGCTGDLMSFNQFKSWVAIVFGQASPEEAEEGIGQLLLASGLEFGSGKDDPEVVARLAMERKLMGEVAKHARFEKGERVVFSDPNTDKVRHGKPIPAPKPAVKAAVPSVPHVESSKAERLKLEQEMMAEMRRKKEAEDGGVEAVKVLLEEEKANGRAKEQEILGLLQEAKVAKQQAQDMEAKLRQYMKDTEAEQKLFRWLLSTISQESKQHLIQLPDKLTAVAKKCFEIGVAAGANNPALAGTGPGTVTSPTTGEAPSPRASRSKKVLSRSAQERRQKERALMAELGANARAEDPASQVLGSISGLFLEGLEVCPMLHRLQMCSPEEALDWKKWLEVQDLSRMTPAAQAAMKHKRSDAQKSTVVLQQEAEEQRIKTSRPEYQQMTRITQWRDCVAGAIPPTLALAITPASPPVTSPPARAPISPPQPQPRASPQISSPQISSPQTPAPQTPGSVSPTPSMRLGAVSPNLTMQLGAVPQSLSMSPSMSPQHPQMAAPAPAPSPSPQPVFGGANPVAATPRQAQRQVRQMGFTLTLREVEMAVRVCKATLIPTDSEEFSIRLHEALMRARDVSGPGGMESPLPAPIKNTEPIRTYARVRLARLCSAGMPRVVGLDGNRTDWTPNMFDKALELLPKVEAEVSQIIIDSKITQTR